jgi:hypothetical protein
MGAAGQCDQGSHYRRLDMVQRTNNDGGATTTQAPPRKKVKKNRVEEVLAARKVVYPEIMSKVCFLKEKGKNCEGPFTVEMAMKALHWEKEDDYKARLVKEAGDNTVKGGEALTAAYGDEYTLKDEYGNKVRCWNNAVYDDKGNLVKTNRMFEESWARSIAQDILTRNYEGNGEAVIIGRTGLILSAQHRLIALVLAFQMWSKNRERWKKYWAEEPYIETFVNVGLSEDEKTLRTLDNVKPRTLSDVFFTSEHLADMNRFDRSQCSRSLDAAVDLVWRRTGSSGRDETFRFQTHSASLGFLQRHGRLSEMTRRVYDENKGDAGKRPISDARLSPGMFSGLLYLMAACESDPKKYYDAGRDEKKLDLSAWDRAQEFLVEFAAKAGDMETVRDALAALKDGDGTLGGRASEKTDTLIKAWFKFYAGENVTLEDLKLDYEQNPQTGASVLVNRPVLKGIDKGDSAPKVKKEEVEEKDEKALEEIERKRFEELHGKAIGVSVNGDRTNVRAFVDATKQKWMTHLLCFANPEGGYDVYEGDADRADGVLSFDVDEKDEMECLSIPKETVPEALKKLARKFKVAVVGLDNSVTEFNPTPAKKGK